VVVILPNTSCVPPVIVQGPPPAPELPPGAYHPYPPSYYPPPVPAPPPGSRTAFSAKLWAGPSYQRLYDLSLYSADFGLSLGGQRGISGWYAELEGLLGRTDHGLSTHQFWIGPTWEGKLDRVHLGLGVHFGFLAIQRATNSGLLAGGGIGVFGFASVDVYQTDDGHALYVGTRMTGDWMNGGSGSTPMLWGPSAALGWRH
jgi:hypothetical protein